jgi:hypothetical protein
MGPSQDVNKLMLDLLTFSRGIRYPGDVLKVGSTAVNRMTEAHRFLNRFWDWVVLSTSIFLRFQALR